MSATYEAAIEICAAIEKLSAELRKVTLELADLRAELIALAEIIASQRKTA